MKACLAIEKFDPAVGGAERYVWDLAHFLARRGHTVEVICLQAAAGAASASSPARGPAGGLECPGGGIRVQRVHPPRFPQWLRHLGFALLHWRAARRMPAAVHFGVGNTFYMDVYQPHGGLHRAWFGRDTQRYAARRRPLVRALRRLGLKDMVQRGMEWWIFRVTRPTVIAISQMVADDMVDFFGYPRERIALVPNGIDTMRFSPDKRARRAEIRARYGIAADEFVFIFVGQNIELKGYGLLLEACRRLAGENFRVLVIGPATAGERRRARDLGAQIVFGGRAADLEAIYPACDCLVHPTYYDACSLVVLEALAAGLPVITTDHNGAAMYIEAGRNGVVIPAGDAAALAAAMQQMQAHEERGVPVVASFDDHATVFEKVEEIMQNRRRP